jgi:(p)ppGpp synthase/HD superfamily hydrolase
MLVERAKLLAEKLLATSRFTHAERVADLLNNPTEIELAAAYLHDILEDTRLDEHQLALIVGKEVTNIVKELTNPPMRYISGVRDFSRFKNASKEAKRVKMADRIDNIKKRFNWINPANNQNLLDYAEESRQLLEFTKDADEKLAVTLSFYIKDLLDKCLNRA